MFRFIWPGAVVRFINDTHCLSSTHASAITQFRPHFYMFMYGSASIVGLIFFTRFFYFSKLSSSLVGSLCLSSLVGSFCSSSLVGSSISRYD
ncbi:hypothetical protein Sjap_013630 [Stephania japonica]|uniref:Uncharacterized protein n=1 Tax=Stephania japonica TaxID=461633 RepID=A0AAP0NYS9_9MAGN